MGASEGAGTEERSVCLISSEWVSFLGRTRSPGLAGAQWQGLDSAPYPLLFQGPGLSQELGREMGDEGGFSILVT